LLVKYLKSSSIFINIYIYIYKKINIIKVLIQKIYKYFFIIWRNFTTFKKNIKFGVYRNLDNSNRLENRRNVTISYNALNEKCLSQDKIELGSTSMLGNETLLSTSQIDISQTNPSTSFTRRKSNFNDYNLEVIRKLEYYDSSKSVIKGSCIIDSKYNI